MVSNIIDLMEKTRKFENSGNNVKRSIKHSQNFLHDNKLVQHLVEKSKLSHQDIVIEIGPGKGIITQQLSKVSKSVVAIELDKALAESLKAKFADHSNVKVVYEDFLSYKLPAYNYKVFSNIPFNITANIINKLLDGKNPPTELFLIMQYEAFLKYAGAPFFKECFKSLIYKPFFNTSILHTFKPTDFKPTPNTKIVLAKFDSKKVPDITQENSTTWKNFLAFVFSEHGANLKEKTKRIFTHTQLKRVLNETGISEGASITEWSYQQWLQLFGVFNSHMVSADKKALVEGTYLRMLKAEDKLTKVHRNRKASNWRKSVKSNIKRC